MLGHSRELDDPVQGHLTPAPSDLRRAERVHEIAGLALEPLAQTGQPLDLGPQAAVRLIARLLEAADPALVAFERAPQRRQARVDLLLTLAQPLLGELQELAVARAERLVAQRFERLLEVHPCLVEDATLLVEALARLVQARVRVGALAALGPHLAPHALDLRALLGQLAAQLVAACLQLRDPDIAGPTLGMAARREVGPEGEPCNPGADGQRDDDEARLKHGPLARASVGRRS